MTAFQRRRCQKKEQRGASKAGFGAFFLVLYAFCERPCMNMKGDLRSSTPATTKKTDLYLWRYTTVSGKIRIEKIELVILR